MGKTSYRVIAGLAKEENSSAGPSTDSDALIINEVQLIL
jgi:hypothetical protein